MSRRNSPRARRRLARACTGLLGSASTSQAPSSTTSVARPRRSRRFSAPLGVALSNASTQASGSSRSAPRVRKRIGPPCGGWLHCVASHCSCARPGSGLLTCSWPGSSCNAKPLRALWRSVRATGWGNCAAQGPGWVLSRHWVCHRASVSAHAPAPWLAPSTCAWVRTSWLPLRSRPCSSSCHCATSPCHCRRTSRNCSAAASWARGPAAATGAMLHCGTRSCACNAMAGTLAWGAVALAASQPACCNWRCSPCQPPVQRASSCACPRKRHCGSKATWPGRPSHQSCVRWGSSSCTCNWPWPSRGPKRPCHWARVPGSSSCSAPSPASVAVSSFNCCA